MKSAKGSLRSLTNRLFSAHREQVYNRRRRAFTRKLSAEQLEKRLALTCSFNPGLNSVTSTGGDVVEFHFNSPSPIVDIYCNGQGYIAHVNANDFFFVDSTQTSLVRVVDYLNAGSGTNYYSVTGSGTTGPAGRVNLESRNKSVMYQGANRIWLIAGDGNNQTGIYPGNGGLNNATFPQVSVYGGTGQTRITIDDSNFNDGDYYRLYDNKLTTARTGDKVLFPNSTASNKAGISLITGNGNDTVDFRGALDNISIMSSQFGQLITNGGQDLLRIWDANSTSGIPHAYQFTEERVNIDGVARAVYSSLENIYLDVGGGSDDVVVGSNVNRLDGVPNLTLAASSGNKTITAIDTGFSSGGDYYLTNNAFLPRSLGQKIFFGGIASLISFNLQTGDGNKNVTLASSDNNLQNVPVFNWQTLGSAGFKNLTVNDSGYSGTTSYTLFDYYLSMGNDPRSLGARVYFPASPLYNPLLQVNVHAGAGNNLYLLSSSQGKFNSLPHFGVFDAGGYDTMLVDDSQAADELNGYVFNEYGGGNAAYANRFFYNQSIEVVQLDVNDTKRNAAILQSTTNTIDSLPQFIFLGPIEELTLYDSGALFIGGGYKVYNDHLSKNDVARVQYSSAQRINLTTTSFNDYIELVLPANFANTAYPTVNVYSGEGFDLLFVSIPPSDPGTQLSISNHAIWRGNFLSQIATYDSNVESVRITGSSGNEVLRFFMTGSGPFPPPPTAAVENQTIANEVTQTYREYIVAGGGGFDQIIVDDSNGNASNTTNIGSNGPQSGFAQPTITPGPLYVYGIFFTETELLDYYQPTGGLMNLSSYHPSDYTLRGGALSLSLPQVVREHQPIGTTVGTLSTTDPDPSITYTLVSGGGDSGNGSFTIVGNLLKTNAVFDRATQDFYSIRVRSSDPTGLSTEQVFFLTVVEATPPRVTSIIAGSTLWTPDFIDSVDGNGQGAGNGLGYLMTPNFIVPNRGLNRLYIQFSENVTGFDQTSIKIIGTNGLDLTNYTTVTYESANMRGVIELNHTIFIYGEPDKYRLGISDSVKDLSFNSLDGDGNSIPGGILDFRFNVLMGDANGDGSVNGGDLPPFANSFNRSTGNALFNPRADWNIDGSVNGGDLPFFAQNFNRSLPSNEPGAITFPPPSLPPEDALYAPVIDDYFRQFGEEEKDEAWLI